MPTTTLPNRVPYTPRSRDGCTYRPVAAVPAAPGLYVHWHSLRGCYVVSAATGLIVATGWGFASDAATAARAVAGLADWETIIHETAMELTVRTVHLLGSTLWEHGGQLDLVIPGTVETARLLEAQTRARAAERRTSDLEELLEEHGIPVPEDGA